MKRSKYVTIEGRTIDIAAFRTALQEWGKANFRVFPWRLTTDPYQILIAEVMLHRTQAKQVLPVYEQFVEAYPDVQKLADVGIAELNDALYSLGLRWRIAAIHTMAKDLIHKFGGEVPRGRVELLSLPGVSDYIAGAVRCFAWNLPETLIDTNTVRIAGRVFGFEIKDSSRRNPRFINALRTVLNQADSRTHNYALLDLADKICTKKTEPSCRQCPVLAWCVHGTSAVE